MHGYLQMVTEVYFFAGRQSNPVREHTDMATPFLERGKIQKTIEFYQIIECDACLNFTKLLNVMHVWALILCFLIREINFNHQFCPFTIT